MDITTHLEELEELGYTIFPRLIAPETTATIRSFIDTEITEGRHSGRDRGGSTYHYRICSPIDHPITTELASDRRILEIARLALRASNLRLRQQMFMRTDPCGEPAPSRPDGWHVDTPFTTAEWNATPRLAFLQVFYYCSPVRTGGAATMVLPASHKKTYPAADALIGTEEGYSAFWQNPAGLSGVDTSTAIEVLVEEGDALFFNPMLLHSGSRNVTDTSRYAFHCSFYDRSAEKVRNLPRPVFYDIFSEAMQAQMPPDLLPLLER